MSERNIEEILEFNRYLILHFKNKMLSSKLDTF
jgi:hypothetical protein